MSKLVGFLTHFILVGAAVFTLSSHAEPGSRAMDAEVIAQRTKPVGKVTVASASTNADQEQASGAAGGEAVYKKYCSVCHAAGLAGAPKYGDKAAWAPRIKGATPADINRLTKHVINGLNAMPPKGTCATCDNEQLKAAVEFMVSKVK